MRCSRVSPSRRKGLVWAAVTVITSCARTTAGDATESAALTNATIQAERVGDLTIGIRAEALGTVGHILDDTTMTAPDGADSERAISILIGQDTVQAFVGSGTVGAVQVRSSRLRTIDSVGVGSRVDAVTEHGLTSAEVLNGVVWLERRDLCGVYFLVAVGGHETGEVIDADTLRAIAARRVHSVVVTRCFSG